MARKKQFDEQKVRQLLNEGKTRNQIYKIVGGRKKTTLENIRKIQNIVVQETDDKTILSIPVKYLKPEQRERKKIIVEKNKIKKELKKRKSKKAIEYERVKKQRLKESNKISKCKHTYITSSHIGFKFEKACNFIIYEDMLDSEIDNIVNALTLFIDSLHNSIPTSCEKRMNYTTLEYKIILYDETTEYSRISTNISGKTGINTYAEMLKQVAYLVYHLVNYVETASSPKEIIIYNAIYVNYDFKSSIK